mmetsp:Transcript_79674/g.234378  ORF Transcript_79674/g.234378 Transcript_79674/m.234378 type:complete len:472 (+) Transcript_79674:71-1486(+)
MTAALFSWLDAEKRYFLLSAVPPLATSLYIMLFLCRSPRPILESISSFVPGLQKPTFKDGMACFRLEARADVIQSMHKLMREHKEIMASDLHAMGVDHRRLLQDGAGALGRFARRLTWATSETADRPQSVPPGNPSHRGLPSELAPGIPEELLEAGVPATEGSGEREIWVNPKHLSLLSLVPTFFLSMYFWDATGLSREASEDFPLTDCMGGDAHCFYNTNSYSIWRYPAYKKLECDEMRDQTMASASGFYFTNPKDAKFYKCYTWVFNSQNFIQATGDVLALLAVIVIVLLYFCVEVTSGVDRQRSEGAEARFLQELKHQRRRCLFWQVALAVVGISALALVSFIYGKLTNDFEVYLGIPGLCLFGVINFHCRRGLLEQRIADLEKEDSDSDESSEEADGSPGLTTSVSAPAALMAVMASLAAGQRESPPPPPTATTYAPAATTYAPRPPQSTLPPRPMTRHASHRSSAA